MKRSGGKFLRWGIALIFALVLPLGAGSHKVQKSETFYSIARKYKVNVNSLMAANGLKDPKKLQLGQTIRIPSKSTSRPTKKATRPTRQSHSKNLVVILDPGHGGRDRGAVWGGVRESDLNLLVAKLAEAGLKRLGYRVVMTRRSDQYVSLQQRARIANQHGNAILVSIHFNATRHISVKGAETFYAGKRGSYLASGIQNQLVSKLNVRNRGIQFRGYSVLRNTACPAVLVECGFISNPTERARCRTGSYQRRAAESIIQGILRYDRKY